MDISKLQKNWDQLGKTDPLWAILTDPSKKDGKWRIAEFFDTGKSEIASLLASLDALPMSVRRGQALDFGCGVGRLTQALAEHFDHVTGIDIAPSMIEQAKHFNHFGNRCTYVLNEVDDLTCFSDNSFDLIYSNITLQHIQPRYTKRYLAEFVRILASSGVLVFQLPSTYVQVWTLRQIIKRIAPSPLLRFSSKLRHHGERPVMETHVIPKNEVVQLLEAQGATIIQVHRNPDHDGRWVSLIYYVSKG